MRPLLFVISLAFSFPIQANSITEDGKLECTDLSHSTSLAVAQITWKVLNCHTLEISYYDENGYRYHQETFNILPREKAQAWISNPSPKAHERVNTWIWNPSRTQLLNHIEIFDNDVGQNIRITNIYSLSGNSVLKTQHREQISLDARENWELRSENSVKSYKRL